MSASTRVKPGVPAGGQFAAAEKSEPNLTLLTDLPADVPADTAADTASEAPAADADTRVPGSPFPDRLVYAAKFPNRAQRADRLNEAYYDIVATASPFAPERIGAARMAMRDTMDFNARFVSLPEDDGEAEALVAEAAMSDQKVLRALDRVGHLEDFEARSFGSRVAGALHDIEIEERDDKAAHAAAMALHAEGEDVEPYWLNDEPPVADFTW